MAFNFKTIFEHKVFALKVKFNFLLVSLYITVPYVYILKLLPDYPSA